MTHECSVAYCSGMAQPDPKAVSNTTYGKAYEEMEAGFASSVDGRCERYSVYFPTLENQRDVLGRKAHVAMLEDGMFLELALIINRLHL